VFLVQVPAPKLAVVLRVCVVPVDGRRVLADELCGGAEDDVVAGAQERRHGHPRSVGVDDGAVPNALISSIAQCLQARRGVSVHSTFNWS
jgi:hypothetical protein